MDNNKLKTKENSNYHKTDYEHQTCYNCIYAWALGCKLLEINYSYQESIQNVCDNWSCKNA